MIGFAWHTVAGYVGSRRNGGSRASVETTIRTFFECTVDIAAIVRLSDNRIAAVNREFQIQTGFRADEAVNRTNVDLRFWCDTEKRKEFIGGIRARGGVRDFETEFRRKDGSIFPGLVSGSAVEFDGEPCVLALVHDISALKHATETIIADAQTLRTIFEASPHAISITRVTDGRYVEVNQAMLDSRNLPRKEVVGHTDEELDLWHDKSQRRELFSRLKAAGSVKNMEVELRNRDGSITPALMSAVVVNLDGEQCLVAFTRDIAAIKQTEIELRSAREEALAASRAKSEFLSSMSHEIRTPMNAILGMADMLGESPLGEEQKRYLNTIVSNGNALLELINGILDLARIESGRLSLEAVEFSPQEIAEKVLDTLAVRGHERRLELMLRIGPGVPARVIGDPLRLSQILINLVGNAIKFTPGGEVTVRIETNPAGAAPGALRFTVIDTGIGIAKDQLGLLFKPFTQADSSTSRKYGGSGLGLAIVARLVALLNGEVEAHSEEGVGSTFSFTAQFGEAASPAAVLMAEPQFNGARILLIDCNRANSEILSEMLAQRGANVTEACSEEELDAALDHWHAPTEHYEVIVLDSKLPHKSGFELANRIMCGAHCSPQIVMMLYTDNRVMELARLREIGIRNCVTKPVKRTEFLDAVARAWQDSRAASIGSAADANTAEGKVAAPRSAASSIVPRALNILLVDDSVDNRALVEAYLEKTPYHLEEAENGQQAIDHFIAGHFDLVLMDIQMPIVDGYEAVTRIRAWEQAHQKAPTPIIALTASALQATVDRCREVGCDVHLSKPVKRSKLLETIRAAVEPDSQIHAPTNGNGKGAGPIRPAEPIRSAKPIRSTEPWGRP